MAPKVVDTGDIGDLLPGWKMTRRAGAKLQPTTSPKRADNELVKLVNKIVIDAYNQGASDIHIESYPGKGKTEIRFRKDGSLAPYIEVPASYRNAIVARIKIMCDLDISEKRRPQDGKIKFKKFGPIDIELRVARSRPRAASRTSSCVSSPPASRFRSKNSASRRTTWRP